MLVVLPRGFLKSTLVTYGLPLWLPIYFGSNIRMLSCTNTGANAAKFGRKIKLTIQTNFLYQTLFPNLIPNNFNLQKWSDTSFCLKRNEEFQESTYEFASTGTNITSRHYNAIISDDILSPGKDNMTGGEIMPTREDVEQCVGWHKLTDSLLIHDKVIPDIVIDAGTRWCKYDYIQYLMDNDKRYSIIDISAIEDGKSNYPSRFSMKVLEGIKERQGTYIFSSQYLNKPYDVSQMLFKSTDLKYYEDVPKGLYIVIANDPAWSKEKQACKTASVVMGIDAERNIYILDYIGKKISPNELVEQNIKFIEKWQPKKLSIETVAAQEVYKELFKNKFIELNMYMPIVDYKPRGDKSERIVSTLEPIISSQKFFIKRDMVDLETELLDFPFGKYRDIIDAISQGVVLLSSQCYSSNKLAPIKKGLFSLEEILSGIDKNNKSSFFEWQEAQLVK